MANAKSTLSVAVVQATSVDRLQENLSFVLKSLEEAHRLGARVAAFPENTLFFRIDAKQPLHAIELNGVEVKAIQDCAVRLDLHVLLTTAVKGSGKVRNSTLHFAPTGQVSEAYSKIHMFDVEVDGAPPVRESDHFEAGQTPKIIDIDGWKWGLSICYDLRFAELFSSYAGTVDVITIPSAFLVPTGQAHWHVMNRARAIEAQCFVVSPAQTGEHCSLAGTVRKTFGHSLMVDPWGVVVSDNDQGPGVRVVELNRERLDWVRRQIPMSSHRRL